ncbi:MULTISPECIES: hypothetical protein [unclassified Bradyrhizobium]|uniref:hypothetical protein n=1 Tax=unclassified Bradyrhizobium TaxID=2631580 RepID=UPI001BADB1F5|nr:MULTISPECIES: hypothetical protein [unclassified Bradyrhizobium]MBR1206759.1 hypothetical protein [Bradyrhizobium sp. AUGA SZCCT0124]MBR1316753.1 hypothetical protein [Bradyrhizobium sp. AUGA SZCCT0051]MBR1344875.1 hypothetical protein [Bradyrhizobium sp. AUGA SZCCT0105]MBR1356329.1 hypothetical protein [Bradyrhizobium sp. AUGA SZCCT0045]
MGHQLAYRAAADGKHPVSKITSVSSFFAIARRPAFAAVAFFVTALASSAGHAQSSPFAGMAGTWSGAGTVTLDDGSSERIRCRATYHVGGPRMTMGLTCASDAYKFNLAADVQAEGNAVTGSWSESSRNVNGDLRGRGGGGNFQVAASAPGFNADISMRTAGNKQSVTIRADSQFRGANITLSK